MFICLVGSLFIEQFKMIKFAANIELDEPKGSLGIVCKLWLEILEVWSAKNFSSSKITLLLTKKSCQKSFFNST